MKFACCTTIDQYDTLVNLGYSAIELAGNKIASMSEEEFAVVKETIQNGQIPCCGFNSSIPANIAIMGDGFDEASITDYAKFLCKRGSDLGIQNIGIGSPLSRVLLSHHNIEEEWAKATRFVEIFAKEAAPYGITILWESLNRLDSNFGLKLIEGKEIIERLGMDNIAIVFDIYHLYIEGEGIAEIKEVLPYIRHMHIAERVGDKRTFPTDAFYDYYKEIIQEVLDGGYTGLLSVESFYGDENVGLPQSKALLDGILAEIE